MSDTGALYSFKGLAGRLAPIGVHASMLAILGGVAWGGIAGFKGSMLAPQGTEFVVADALHPASPFAQLPSGGCCLWAAHTKGSGQIAAVNRRSCCVLW